MNRWQVYSVEDGWTPKYRGTFRNVDDAQDWARDHFPYRWLVHPADYAHNLDALAVGALPQKDDDV